MLQAQTLHQRQRLRVLWRMAGQVHRAERAALVVQLPVQLVQQLLRVVQVDLAELLPDLEEAEEDLLDLD
jgi:hypothetical protein